jgi:tyrosine-protein phosphatase non-receptor type 4
LGDFCADDHKTGYISGLKLVANQTPEFEKTVADMHRLHRGETPADAELHFLQEAKRLDMYGVELHRAKDTAGREIQIGVSGNGLLVLHSGQKVSHFSWAKIVKISFKRRHFFVQLRREGVSIVCLHSSGVSSEAPPLSQTERFDSLLGFNSCSYRTCKSLWKACVEQHTFFRLQSPKPHTKKFFFFFSLGSRFRYSGKTEFQTIEENRKRLSRADRAFVRTRTNRFTRQTVPIPHINNLMLSSRAILHNGDPKTARVQSTESPAKSAWLSLNRSVLGLRVHPFYCLFLRSSSAFCPSLKSLPFIDKDSAENRLSAALSDDSSPVHLVAIHMTPDADGRFGFNVKGGHDQNCPVLVSRVAPNTPADNASPRLREGDQVMTINGSDVTGLSHEQIVQLIRSTRDSGPDAQLVLQIRPNGALFASLSTALIASPFPQCTRATPFCPKSRPFSTFRPTRRPLLDRKFWTLCPNRWLS